MGTRTVRLDKQTERTLQSLRRTTGLSISEVLKRGVQAYSEQAAIRAEASPYEVFRCIELGEGGWAVARARDAKSGIRGVLARKQRR